MDTEKEKLEKQEAKRKQFVNALAELVAKYAPEDKEIKEKKVA